MTRTCRCTGSSLVDVSDDSEGVALFMSNCTFEANSVATVVNNHGVSNMSITDCSFNYNRDALNIITVVEYGILNMTGCTIQGNLCSESALGLRSASVLFAGSVDFVNNSGVTGGAIYCRSPPNYGTGSRSPRKHGTGSYDNTSVIVHVKNSHFEANYADAGE
jgi:predicted outer membrane repeat protein